MKMISVVTLVLMAVTVLLPLVMAQNAMAHSVEMSFSPRQGYEVTAGFAGAEPLANAEALVFSPADQTNPWMVGQADANGRFFFIPDHSVEGIWEVLIRDNAGHGGIVQIEVDGSGATAGQMGGFTTVQIAIMVAAVAWGAVGTALFFRSRTA